MVSDSVDNVSNKLKQFGNKTKDTYNNISVVNRLKILIAILLIPVIIFSAMPFVSASAEVSLQGGVGGNTKSVDIISPKDEITDFSVIDMLSNKSIPNYEIYGKEIGDIGLFGVSLYDLITMPVPNYGIISRISEFLNGSGVEILQNQDVRKFLTDNFGDVGANICSLMDTALQYVDQAKAITADAQTIYDAINSASQNIRSTIMSINMVKSYASLAFYIIPVLLLAGVLLLLKRKPTYAPAVLLTVLTSVLVIVGIGVACANGAIANQMGQISGELSAIISNAVSSYIPNLNSTLAMLGISTNVYIGLYVYCSYGYYLLTATIAAMAAIAYVIPVYQKKHTSI